MLQKRSDYEEEGLDRNGGLAAMETARSATESSSKGATEPKKEEEHISLFWRIFGGTILSIVALVAITLYNNLTSSISDLRSDLSHEREARAELVKKDEFNSRVTAQYERMRAIDSVKVELEGLKEKVQSTAAGVESAKKDTTTTLEAMKKDTAATTDAMKKDIAAANDGVKKDAAAIDVLKERIAAIESVRKDLAALDVLKEKLTSATADLKTVRDEVMKLSSDVEKNKASDLERKTSRDAQYKQVEETLKELQKALQDCREKLARLEGAKAEIPAPTPATPGKNKP